ncbi:SDR family NAD(P)-dependent oxidoreductase [Oscillatoria sp. CS-180]|uniref:SDR family NAD(P)-dependent oxidoreductase n=1 Tax=Oscillatoria sp. CS-180 TaxID=3021720 RepID=UPI00232BC07A|nr:SDR family NAD(P)-dependent oxidoreductase [Oscillatoria sp. CS-180]MDB9528858.1 SDR family NAD(P)-dependent oxidoreductase [Oscillatoria sp. CS-180]
MMFGDQLQKGTALVVGASQGIGLEFVKQLLKDDRIEQVFATYRNSKSATDLFAFEDNAKLRCLQAEATREADIAQVAADIAAQRESLHLMVNCVGVLHHGELQPEKSLRQIEAERLLNYFQINSIPTVLLAKQLQPLLKKSDRSVFATISAKIGSIEDNRLGGWYGYRASKAALNMFLKNIAIEYSRKNPQTTVVALHPGTTNTRLSKPFQRNVPPEKLFPVERTVTQLLDIIDRLTERDNGSFFSWDGSRLPW